MSDLKNMLEEQGLAFKTFKAHYAERLEHIENSLENMEAISNRPGGPNKEGHLLADARKSADVFMRTGEGLDPQSMAPGSDLQASISTTAGGGGYLVPAVMADHIYSLMNEASPMRQLCNVVNPRSGDYSQPIALGGGVVTHVGEENARPETNTPTFTEVKAVMGECYFNWPLTQRALDDSAYDLQTIIESEGSRAIAETQNADFVSGNGTNKPKGFLDHTMSIDNDANRTFGQIQYIPTGVDGDFGTGKADDLLSLIYKMKAGLRQGASFQMNSETISVIRKWKNADGDYIWQQSMQAGQPSTLFGFPVHENEDMPAIGSGTTPIAFGNWKRAYTIVDRTLHLLRDPFTNKPYVNIYMSAYYGGMLVDSEAVKVLKLSAT